MPVLAPYPLPEPLMSEVAASAPVWEPLRGRVLLAPVRRRSEARRALERPRRPFRRMPSEQALLTLSAVRRRLVETMGLPLAVPSVLAPPPPPGATTASVSAMPLVSAERLASLTLAMREATLPGSERLLGLVLRTSSLLALLPASVPPSVVVGVMLHRPPLPGGSEPPRPSSLSSGWRLARLRRLRMAHPTRPARASRWRSGLRLGLPISRFTRQELLLVSVTPSASQSSLVRSPKRSRCVVTYPRRSV